MHRIHDLHWAVFTQVIWTKILEEHSNIKEGKKNLDKYLTCPGMQIKQE